MATNASKTALPTDPVPWKPGVKEVVLALEPDMKFEAIVKVLQEVLVVPELPGIRGCRPCLSGLDRFIIQSNVLRSIR